MEIEDFFNENRSFSTKTALDFEVFVINLLDTELTKEGKTFFNISNKHSFGDAIINDDYRSLSGTTLIEIKYKLNNTFIASIENKILNSELENSIEIDNLLFISAQEVTTKTKERFSAHINNLNKKIKIEFWGPSQLNKIINKNKRFVKNINNNYLSYRIDSVLKKEDVDWKFERKKVIEKLKHEFKHGKMSLLLGAGVSSSAGLPDWNTLINTLFVNYLSGTSNDSNPINDLNAIVNRLNDIDSKSALLAARYIKKGISNKKSEEKEFYNEVKKILYGLRNTDYPLESELIKAINNMSIYRRDGACIQSIITYNFDDLIERHIDPDINQYKCIYLDSDTFSTNELPIYHVHGFLPEDDKKYPNINKSTLVFSEEGYHKIYSEPYHWSNLVQLNTLRDNVCLMIGLSMTDPNLRRLLDIASINRDEPRHFAFLKRITSHEFIYEKKIRIIESDENVNKFLVRHHVLNEELFKDLGVTIIWYEDYDEIPVLIKEIYKNGI